jgi:protein SCO1/2
MTLQRKTFGALAMALLAIFGAAARATAAAQDAAVRPDDLIARVDVEQKLGTPLPLDARLRDELGRDVTLGSYFGRRPVVLALVYYECPMLCTLVLNGLLRAAKPLEFDAGDEFDVVVLSFDPGETPELARAKKAHYLEAYQRPGTENGWHFLTGDQASIEAVTESLGFRYAYDPQRDEYAHAAAIFVATPEGKIARYLFGVEYAPRDLRLALVEAAAQKIGTLADKLLLLCYHYDPATGRYSNVALGALRVAGVATVAGVAALILALRRREHVRGGAGRRAGAVSTHAATTADVRTPHGGARGRTPGESGPRRLR